jgi:hypothetical protein
VHLAVHKLSCWVGSFNLIFFVGFFGAQASTRKLKNFKLIRWTNVRLAKIEHWWEEKTTFKKIENFLKFHLTQQNFLNGSMSFM